MSKIEHFAIYAADAPRLKDFYVEAFGMTVLVDSGGDPPAYFLGDSHGGAIEIIGRPPGQVGRQPAAGSATWRSGSMITTGPTRLYKGSRDRVRDRHGGR